MNYIIRIAMDNWKSLNIRTELLNALKLKNFTKPTKIQSESIPPAIDDQRDILGAAETGSGKTLAFAIPILNGILSARSTETNADDSDEGSYSDLGSEDSAIEPEILELDENGLGCVSVVNLPPDSFTRVNNKKLWAVILVPTRELAMQVKNHIDDIAKYTDIHVAAIVGGLSSEKQERLLKKGPEIVVATPGRLWELVQRNEPHLMQLNKVKYFVIDEADRMVETAHFPELHLMLEKINLKRNNKRQNFVFSATLTMVHKAPYRPTIKTKKKKKHLSPEDKLKSLIQLIGMKNPHVVNLTTANCVTSTVKEMQIFCSVAEKDGYLYYFLKRNPGRSLVFCNSISCVKRLASVFNILKLNPLPIHSNMIQKQRLKNLDKFRANDLGLLLATDVAARGLDIVGVNHVIHYDVPRTAEIYVHRSGRTARASNVGLSLLICTPDKKNVYLNVLRTMKREKELPRFEVELRSIRMFMAGVKLAQEVSTLEEKVKKETASTNWFNKAAEEMEILLDEDELPRGMGKSDLQQHKKLVNSKRKQLDMILSTVK